MEPAERRYHIVSPSYPHARIHQYTHALDKVLLVGGGDVAALQRWQQLALGVAEQLARVTPVLLSPAGLSNVLASGVRRFASSGWDTVFDAVVVVLLGMR